MDTQKEWMTIERTPDAEWIVESARHLAGAENQGRHHIFVDAVGPDGADLRGTGLAVAFGWKGMSDDETPTPMPIDKPAGEFGCHIPIFENAVMHVAMHGAPSEMVTGIRTNFDDGEEGNSVGHQSFHVVFRYAPASQAAPEPPKPKTISRKAVTQAAAKPIILEEPIAEAAIPTGDELPTANLDGWTYRSNARVGGRPTYTKTFNNGLSALTIDTGVIYYLASMRLPDGQRIGQQHYLFDLAEAKQWAEEQAAAIISSVEKVQRN